MLRLYFLFILPYCYHFRGKWFSSVAFFSFTFSFFSASRNFCNKSQKKKNRYPAGARDRTKTRLLYRWLLSSSRSVLCTAIGIVRKRFNNNKKKKGKANIFLSWLFSFWLSSCCYRWFTIFEYLLFWIFSCFFFCLFVSVNYLPLNYISTLILSWEKQWLFVWVCVCLFVFPFFSFSDKIKKLFFFFF